MKDKNKPDSPESPNENTEPNPYDSAINITRIDPPKIHGNIVCDGDVCRLVRPAGFSDLFGIRNGDGRAVFIEVKTKKGKATDAQLKFLETMRNRGALAGIARSVQDAIEIVEG